MLSNANSTGPEIQREREERVERLVEVYGHQQQDYGKDNTIANLQRTQKALDAIDQQNWAEACQAMLDYDLLAIRTGALPLGQRELKAGDEEGLQQRLRQAHDLL